MLCWGFLKSLVTGFKDSSAIRLRKHQRNNQRVSVPRELNTFAVGKVVDCTTISVSAIRKPNTLVVWAICLFVKSRNEMHTMRYPQTFNIFILLACQTWVSNHDFPICLPSCTLDRNSFRLFRRQEVTLFSTIWRVKSILVKELQVLPSFSDSLAFYGRCDLLFVDEDGERRIETFVYFQT